MKNILVLILLIPHSLMALTFEMKSLPTKSYIAFDLNGQEISPYKSEKNSCRLQFSQNMNSSMDLIFYATYLKTHTEKNSLFSKGYSQLRFEGQNSTGQQIVIICRAQDRILDIKNAHGVLYELGEFI